MNWQSVSVFSVLVYFVAAALPLLAAFWIFRCKGLLEGCARYRHSSGMLQR